MKQTFFFPGYCMDTYPQLVEAVLEGGHEVGLHGYLHEVMNDQDAATELEILERGLEAAAKLMDSPPIGWRAPLYAISDRSPELLLDHGFVYDASLMGDDQPYLLRTPKGDLVELPSETANDDWTHYAHVPDLEYMMQIRAPEVAEEVYRAEFEAAYRHGGLWISVWHPSISARLSRLEVLARMLRRHAGARRRLGRAAERDRRARATSWLKQVNGSRGWSRSSGPAPRNRVERRDPVEGTRTPIPARTGWSGRLKEGQSFSVDRRRGRPGRRPVRLQRREPRGVPERPAHPGRPRGRSIPRSAGPSSPTSAGRSSSSPTTPRRAGTTAWRRPATRRATCCSAPARTTARARRTCWPRPRSTASTSTMRSSRSTCSRTSGSTRRTAGASTSRSA